MPYITSLERMAREEGREEGRLQTARQSIISVLQFRFTDEVAESLREEINQINELSLLQNLLLQAVASSSMAEFAQEMNRINV